MGIIHKIGLTMAKNADKILIAAGIIGVGVGVGIACKDTMSGIDELNQAKVDICEKDYIPAIKRFGKVYWPSFVIIGGSMFMIINGHRILVKKYAGLVVAYESLNKSYKGYRSYISENYGKETDFAARHADEKATIDGDLVYVDPDDIFIPDRDLSDYAVLFGKGYSLLIDEQNDDPESVFNQLRSTEEWANAVLKERGYIFLQEVYEGLGLIEKYAPDGVGWCEGVGDNYVDFGIYSLRNGDAVNHLEPMYWLDFNHDGYILPYI